MNKIVFILILLPIVAVSGEIRQFGGMNTNSNRNLVQEYECHQAVNWLFDDPDWALTVRPGIVAVSDSVDNYTKINSLHSHKYSGGKGYNFQLLENTDSGWADLWSSDAYGYQAYDSLLSYLYPDRAHWVSWLDNIMLFNGWNKPKIIVGGPDNMKARHLVPVAPGQPDVEVIDRIGELYGEYKYSFWCKAPCSTLAAGQYWSVRSGPMSPPTNVLNKTARISGLLNITADYNCPIDYDIMEVKLLRTRANKFNIDDSLFVIDSFEVDTGDAFDWSFYDDIADTALGSSKEFFAIIGDAQDFNPTGYNPYGDEDDPEYWYALGELTFSSVDTTTDKDTILPYITSTTPPDTAYGLSYVMTFMDPETGAHSDSGPTNLVVFETLTVTSAQLRIPLPPDPKYDRVISRAVVFDHAKHMTNTYDYYVLDTVKSDTATTYTDSLGTPQLLLRSAYERLVPDGIFKGAIVHEGKLFAWDDYYVYVSQSGSPGEWGLFDAVTFDMDDGDRIINLVSYEGFIIVYKTNSIYILYTDDGDIYDRSKKSFGVGMIAPFSKASYNGKNLFFSKKGLSLETGNVYRDQSLQRDYISDPIKNQIVRSVDDMVDVAAAVIDDILLLSYPGTDSSFVYSFANNAWGKWTFDFEQACLYDTVESSNWTPFNQLMFIKDDDERLYIYTDTTWQDDGVDYTATWEKRYLSMAEYCQIFEHMNLWRDIPTNDTDSVIIIVTNEEIDTLGTVVFDSLTYRLSREYMLQSQSKTAHWFNMTLTAPNRENFTIDQIDYFVSPAGFNIGK